MKICILSPMGIYPERNDGPAVNAYNLAISLSSLGNECHVIVGTRFPQNLANMPKKENINIYPFTKDWGFYQNHVDAEKYLSSTLTLFRLASRIPIVFRKICKTIDAITPDILFYNLVPCDPLSPLPFVYRLKNRVQVVRIPVWFPMELNELSKNRLIKSTVAYAYKKIVKQFNIVVTQSTWMRQNIIKEVGVTPPCVVIPNGVDVERFAKKVNHERDCVRIIFVGRLSREKGLEDLMRALSLQSPATLSKIEVSIVGDGSTEYMLHLYELAAKLGIKHKITFYGEVNWTAISSFYKNSDIFVLPSYREGFPQVLLEAMASGLAIVATNISGVQDIVKGDNGLLFEKGDVKKLAEHIEILVNDSKIRRSMSEKAYHTALDFSWRNIGKRYMTLFRNLLNFEQA